MKKQKKKNRKTKYKRQYSSENDSESEEEERQRFEPEAFMITQEDYQRIMEEEKIGTRLRLDNFAILLYLTDNNDNEVKDCFINHLKQKKGQSKLITQLTSKTEETYLALLEKYLNNEE